MPSVPRQQRGARADDFDHPAAKREDSRLSPGRAPLRAPGENTRRLRISKCRQFNVSESEFPLHRPNRLLRSCTTRSSRRCRSYRPPCWSAPRAADARATRRQFPFRADQEARARPKGCRCVDRRHSGRESRTQQRRTSAFRQRQNRLGLHHPGSCSRVTECDSGPWHDRSDFDGEIDRFRGRCFDGVSVLVGGGFSYITMKNFKRRTLEYFSAKRK